MAQSDKIPVNGNHPNGNGLLEVVQQDYSDLHYGTQQRSHEDLNARIVQHWNAREWQKAASCIENLDESLASSIDPTIDRRLVRLLLGICFSFRGYWQWSKAVFESLITEKVLRGADKLDPVEISAAHWLGDTCLLLRKRGDAALAWAIAYHYMSTGDGTSESDRQRVLIGLSVLENGQLLKGVRALSSLLVQMRDPKRGSLSILPQLSIARKSSFISAVIPVCAKGTPSTEISTFSERPEDILLDRQCFSDPFNSTKPWPLRYDSFLMLDPKKFLHVREFGLPVNKHQMNVRFLPNIHNRVRMTSVFTTKQSLEWLVSTVESTLASRGMLCAHYFDRMKVIRVREFGLMDYVVAFSIIFIKSITSNSMSIQVPLLDVRTDWKTINEPAVKAHTKLVEDIKVLLKDAESRDDPLTQRYMLDATVATKNNTTGAAGDMFHSNNRPRSIDSRRSLLGAQSDATSIAGESMARQPSVAS